MQTVGPWRVAAIAGLMLASCVVTPAASGPRDARLDEAEAAVLAGDFGRARDLYARVGEAGDAAGVGARCAYWIGVCHRRTGDAGAAGDAFRRALASREATVRADARRHLAALAFAAGRWAEARECAQGALDDGVPLAEDARDARLLLARATYRAGDAASARAALRGLAADTPADAAVAVALAAAEAGAYRVAVGPFDTVESAQAAQAALEAAGLAVSLRTLGAGFELEATGFATPEAALAAATPAVARGLAVEVWP